MTRLFPRNETLKKYFFKKVLAEKESSWRQRCEELDAQLRNALHSSYQVRSKEFEKQCCSTLHFFFSGIPGSEHVPPGAGEGGGVAGGGGGNEAGKFLKYLHAMRDMLLFFVIFAHTMRFFVRKKSIFPCISLLHTDTQHALHTQPEPEDLFLRFDHINSQTLSPFEHIFFTFQDPGAPPRPRGRRGPPPARRGGAAGGEGAGQEQAEAGGDEPGAAEQDGGGEVREYGKYLHFF